MVLSLKSFCFKVSKWTKRPLLSEKPGLYGFTSVDLIFVNILSMQISDSDLNLVSCLKCIITLYEFISSKNSNIPLLSLIMF